MEMQDQNTVVAPATPAPAAAPVEAVPAPVQTPVIPAPVALATGAPVTPAQPVQPQAPAETDNQRTREQFEKLLESNKRLYDANELLRQELQQRAQASQQFAPIQQPPVQQPQQAPKEVNPQDFVEVDPVTGERYINEAKLQSRIQDLTQKATRAEQVVNNYIQTAEEREIDRQNREAFSAYPDLNPSSAKFDVRFSNQTRAVIYDSLINPYDYNGKPLSFKEAADFVRGQQPAMTTQIGITNQAPAPAVQPAQEQGPSAQVLKEQVSATVPAQQPAVRESISDEDVRGLVLETRKGSLEALAKRLTMADHTAKRPEAN